MLSLIPILFAVSAVEPSTSRLAVIRAAPKIALTDAHDKKVSLKQFRGKATLVAFFFTTCSGACPATTQKLVKIQEEIAKRKGLQDRVQLLSVTIDPERDTVEKLRSYMRLYDVNKANWSFLTGTPARIEKTLAAWDVWAKPAANGQLDHPSRVYLIDPQGRIREIYSLEFLQAPWVIEDIELLLK